MRLGFLAGLAFILTLGAAPPLWAAPPLCAISGTVYQNAAPAANARVTFSLTDTQHLASSGAIIRKTAVTVITNTNGTLPALNLVQGIPVSVTVNGGDPETFTVPAHSSADMTSFFQSYQ